MAKSSKKAMALAAVATVEIAGEDDARDVGKAVADVAPAAPQAQAADSATVSENGAVLFIPLNKLKKSPKNARKTPHSEAHVEALAASIAVKGMLQNLVVEPETKDGEPTGFYFVTIGEGRRLAHLLLAKRRQMKKTQALRCVLDTANDPAEISLDENVTREALSIPDQVERFRELAENRGWGAEEIAARFGVTAHVVRQRLRLGAVSPKLMQVYRDGGLTLDQLIAFAITEDHGRQEAVYDNLSYNREPSQIRRDLTKMNVAATDRRAIFVGAEAYTEAGGTIIRDLFTEDRGGYFEDAALLDRLVIEKLDRIAAEVRETEGWKWTSMHIDYPHAHGMRRAYPHPVELSQHDTAALEATQAEYDRLTAEYDGVDELPEDVDAKFAALEAEIERIETKQHAYEPNEIAQRGVFIVLGHDGEARIERGFIRPADEAPDMPENSDGKAVIDGVCVNSDGEVIEDGDQGAHSDASETGDEDDVGKPLSDALVRDLTAYRTLGLRLALGEQPDIALIAVVHALATQTFYRGADVSCLEIRLNSVHLASHADGIEDTAPAKALAERHAGWAADMPVNLRDLWGFVAALDRASLMALLAHCASLTVNAVRLPCEREAEVRDTTEQLATALALDMTAHWTPAKRTYFGRITKAHILAAVKEAAGEETAGRIAGMKKVEMAQAAEQLIAATDWLPPLLRTERPASLDADADQHHAEQAQHFSVTAE
ncbi:ParB/RepB/Spo0J family partition protein [Bradyrhizobium sp.]|uniref:ParB/RepB/Spo0J family partition protein n=4 Tax=Bradyrhizobium sp. TaxID=376 RepID=UPI00391BB278